MPSQEEDEIDEDDGIEEGKSELKGLLQDSVPPPSVALPREISTHFLAALPPCFLTECSL